jgi:hypothetical protein
MATVELLYCIQSSLLIHGFAFCGFSIQEMEILKERPRAHNFDYSIIVGIVLFY